MKTEQQVSQNSTPAPPRLVRITPEFYQKFWMGVPRGGQVKVGLRQNKDGSVEVAIQTRHATYRVPQAVASPSNLDSISAKAKIQQWVLSSIWEGNIPSGSLYPLNGSGNDINPHSSRRCITTFPLLKHGLRVMQDYDVSRRVFFLYLEGFKDHEFFTSNRPIAISDFANPDGPLRQTLSKLSQPAIIFDLKLTSLHPRSVLSWAASNGLTKDLPQLHGRYWNKDGNQYLEEGGRIGLVNTQDGGRFLADMLVEVSSGAGPHPLVSGYAWVLKNKQTINAQLSSGGASSEFIRAFGDRLNALRDLGALGVGLNLLSTGAKVRAVRPPSLNTGSSFFSSRRFRQNLSNRPSTPGNTDNYTSAPPTNAIVPFNRIPHYNSVP